MLRVYPAMRYAPPHELLKRLKISHGRILTCANIMSATWILQSSMSARCTHIGMLAQCRDQDTTSSCLVAARSNEGGQAAFHQIPLQLKSSYHFWWVKIRSKSLGSMFVSLLQCRTFFAEKNGGHRGMMSVVDTAFLVFIGFLYPPPAWKAKEFPKISYFDGGRVRFFLFCVFFFQGASSTRTELKRQFLLISA